MIRGVLRFCWSAGKVVVVRGLICEQARPGNTLLVYAFVLLAVLCITGTRAFDNERVNLIPVPLAESVRTIE